MDTLSSCKNYESIVMLSRPHLPIICALIHAILGIVQKQKKQCPERPLLYKNKFPSRNIVRSNVVLISGVSTLTPLSTTTPFDQTRTCLFTFENGLALAEPIIFR
jgi:hypothetical protein